MSDPIADLLIRVKNGYLANKDQIESPWSKILEQIAYILKECGYLNKVAVKEDKFKRLVLTLKYDQGQSVVTGVKRVSKPGVRRYVKYSQIPYVRSGFGTTIISTSKGLMTGDQARKDKLGGEILCEVW